MINGLSITDPTQIVDTRLDPITHGLLVNNFNFVWDTGALSWIKSTVNGVGPAANVNVTNFPATQPISGSVSVLNFPATQPVSGTITVASITNPIHAIIDSGIITSITNPVTISGTVGVSGNVTVIQPTGTSLHTVLDSGTITSIINPVAVTQSGSWNVGLNAGSNVIGHVIVDSGAITVSGTVAISSISGNVTVIQPTGTSLHTVIDSGIITSITNPVAVTGTFWQTTQPVSGTVTIDTITNPVTVIQSIGTSLHAVLDSGALTSITNPVVILGAQSAPVTGIWDNTTPVDTAIQISTTGYGTVQASCHPTYIPTSGVISFEASDDAGLTWYSIDVSGISGSGSETAFNLSKGQRAWQGFIGGFNLFRVRLSTAISSMDGGIVNIRVQTFEGSADPSTITVVQPLGSQLHTVVDSGLVNATLQGTSNTSDATTADLLIEVLAELRAMNADNGIFTDYI